MPASTRTSGAAIASLICGLLVCVPIVTGLLAFILGLVGISSTKNPLVRGRGMAVAGLILGSLSIIVWCSISLSGARLWQRTAAERALATVYVNDLAAGNLDADVARSTGNVTHDYLAIEQQQMQPWGALQTSFIFVLPIRQPNGSYLGATGGTCQFVNGQHRFQMRIIKDVSGALLVDSFQWTN
jgi:hypothetical protein